MVGSVDLVGAHLAVDPLEAEALQGGGNGKESLRIINDYQSLSEYSRLKTLFYIDITKKIKINIAFALIEKIAYLKIFMRARIFQILRFLEINLYEST